MAWHFLKSNGSLRDGRPRPADGEWLEYHGPLELCVSGLHASVRAIDALGYAPGPIVCRVECGGEVLSGTDKLCCSRRKIVWHSDASEVLSVWARSCARRVRHLWKEPDVVRRWLDSGDLALRAEARSAAQFAAAAAAAASDDDVVFAAAAASASASSAAIYGTNDERSKITDQMNDELEQLLAELAPKGGAR